MGALAKGIASMSHAPGVAARLGRRRGGDMDQRIALVTGADKSIGLEAVRGLARLGMTVYLTSRNPETTRGAAEALAADGDVRALPLDVTDEAAIQAALALVERAHGRLDVLINNAGMALEPRRVLDVPMDDVRRTIEVNLLGPTRLTQLAAPLLRKSKAGRVVMVSSGAARLDFLSDPAAPKPYAYCLSKVGLNAATLMLADAFRADGIKVNAVNPGYVYSAVSFFRGTRSPADGAAVLIKYATLDDDGPTGGFFDERGPLSW
jgi:NAD(P)-dependent dehydrogenase (short-subunit alcohol dehydrogenase family)